VDNSAGLSTFYTASFDILHCHSSTFYTVNVKNNVFFSIYINYLRKYKVIQTLNTKLFIKHYTDPTLASSLRPTFGGLFDERLRRNFRITHPPALPIGKGASRPLSSEDYGAPFGHNKDLFDEAYRSFQSNQGAESSHPLGAAGRTNPLTRSTLPVSW